MSQLWYKATLSNVPVVFQNEAWSSKRCSRCGAMGTRCGDNFKCGACGYHTQADVNGAMNIALAYRRGREWLVPTAESVATQVATVPETHEL
jgi:transposase